MLGNRTLVPTDEGRYAEMAREMLATGDWITTRLNGIKYFEKPPLQIWMTALAFKVFGLGEWQARLWTGLCGYAGILLTGVAGMRVFGRRTGLAAALILASSLFWSAMGHINTLDMGLAGGMTLALCGMLVSQVAAGPTQAVVRRNWMLACWAGMALAVLSKGLIGLALPGAVLIVYTLVARDWAIWTRLHLLAGLTVFAAITVPWFVLVSLQNPEFARFFFIHEHFERFTSKVHHRVGAWYYFLPILVAGLLPWLAVTVQALWAGCRAQPTGTAAAAPPVRFQPKKLLLVWSILIFVFFSASGSKLPSYILPIFPALALLLATYLQDAPRRAWWLLSGSVAFLGFGMLVLVAQMPQFAKDAVDLANYHAAQPWAAAAALALLAGSLPVLWWCRRGAPAPAGIDVRLRATVALSVAGFAAVQLLLLGAEPHGRTRSGIALVPAIAAELTPATPLYAVGLYDQTLPFYLRRTMTQVAHADELAFGLQQQPELWLPTREAFVTLWRNGPKAVAITRPEIFAQMQAQGVPMRLLARDDRRVAITNR
ncbi:MAG: glycosyltransferase family 39 protein [Herminiimonas sp.]|nr:glycosyltransferase family 39 protein [Herminiimonas sp.]